MLCYNDNDRYGLPPFPPLLGPMPTSPLRTSLLAIALILGQWLALAHASEHVAPTQDPSCEVCVHADRHGSGPALQHPALALATPGCEAPASQPAQPGSSAEGTIGTIRGPPGRSFRDKE